MLMLPLMVIPIFANPMENGLKKLKPYVHLYNQYWHGGEERFHGIVWATKENFFTPDQPGRIAGNWFTGELETPQPTYLGSLSKFKDGTYSNVESDRREDGRFVLYTETDPEKVEAYKKAIQERYDLYKNIFTLGRFCTTRGIATQPGSNKTKIWLDDEDTAIELNKDATPQEAEEAMLHLLKCEERCFLSYKETKEKPAIRTHEAMLHCINEFHKKK